MCLIKHEHRMTITRSDIYMCTDVNHLYTILHASVVEWHSVYCRWEGVLRSQHTGHSLVDYINIGRSNKDLCFTCDRSSTV